MLLFCLRDGFANIACYSGLTAFMCFRCVLASAAWPLARPRAAPWAARGAMEAFLSLENAEVADWLRGEDSSNSCLCFSLPQPSVDAFRRFFV